MRPAVRAMVTSEVAETLLAMNPMRQQRTLFSDKNPLIAGVADMANKARESRKRASEDNPFVKLERLQADYIETAWNFYRDARDAAVELTFHGLYGTPWMKAIAEQEIPPHISHEIEKFPEVQHAVERIEAGGYKEAIIRMLVLLAQARGSVRRDRLERSNKMLHSRPPFDTMHEDTRTALIHEQSLIVQFAPEHALASLPKLLTDDVDRLRAINLVMDIAGPYDEMDPSTIAMFKRIQWVLRTVPHDWSEPVKQEDGTPGLGHNLPPSVPEKHTAHDLNGGASEPDHLSASLELPALTAGEGVLP